MPGVAGCGREDDGAEIGSSRLADEDPAGSSHSVPPHPVAPHVPSR